MNINKDNYEAFFLDYHEGNLSTQEVADLFLFLSQHPELKKEFEEFEHIILEDFSNPVFEHKDLLKKNITADNREEYFIRAVENTLDPSELILLDQFLKAHPEFLAEFNLFKKTKVQAEETIVFENKTHLKQPLAANDEYLISVLEGLLPEKEQLHFQKQLTIHPELQKSFALYQKTKVITDNTVVYPDKQSLKRKERNIIPLYYYIAAAASIALLIGLFFFWRTTTDASHGEGFAEQREQHQQPVVKEQPDLSGEKKYNPVQTSGNVNHAKNKNSPFRKQSKRNASVNTTPVEIPVGPVIETIPLNNNPIASAQPASEKQSLLNQADSISLQQHKHIDPMIAKIESKKEATVTPGYTSLRDALTAKLKEKLIGKDAVQTDERNNAPKKISGWDVAGVVAKGLTKLTGKKIEVKPQFNSEGTVTAYALSAGKLEFSRIK